jgi:hypothetical protein
MLLFVWGENGGKGMNREKGDCALTRLLFQNSIRGKAN